MEENKGELEELKRQLAYYRRRVDEQAGRLLQADYAVSGFQHEILQKRRGFALLSQLQDKVAGIKETNQVFKLVSESINSELGMDRTVILLPIGAGNDYQVLFGLGFHQEEEAQLVGRMITLPDSFGQGTELLVVNKATQATPLSTMLKELLGLPYFVCMPIVGDSGAIGILLTGRSKEVRPLYPPLDKGDVETFGAMGGLIAATVKNMRVAVLQEMDRLKTEFFANISHEFRTPITLTLGPLESLLAGRYGAISEEVRPHLDVMLRNQHRLLDLINQILDLAKLESGKMSLAVTREEDLNGRVIQVVEQFRGIAEKRYLVLKATTDPALNRAELYVDREKLDRLLFNLLSNSVKFTRAGGVEVSTHLEEGTVRIEVADTGIGIRSDQLPYIFDRFRQADGSASREYAGTGIGLALVSEVVKLHGGTIQVRSEVGKGSVFTIRLPLGKEHLDPACILENPEPNSAEAGPSQLRALAEESGNSKSEAAALNAESEARKDGSRPTVLYADDNADLRSYVRSLLAPDYNLFLAVDGEDGLAQALHYRPDLILSDWMMPTLTGPELCERVRSEPRLEGTPFVLLTAKSSADSRLVGLEGGADDFLNKPFSAPELLARVKNLVALRRQNLRLRRELTTGGEIQRALLPPQSQWFGDAEVSVLFAPSNELSGDFYDVIHRPPFLYFYLAQATSQGIGAAQVTFVIREAVRAALEQEGDESHLETLIEGIRERYATRGIQCDVAFHLARYHRREKTLQLARAVAAPARIFSRNGRADVPSYSSLPPLSARDKAQLETERGDRIAEQLLQSGDRLFLFTDGAYLFDSGEAPDRGPFGLPQLEMVLAASNRERDWRSVVWTAMSKASGSGRMGRDVTVMRLSIT